MLSKDDDELAAVASGDGNCRWRMKTISVLDLRFLIADSNQSQIENLNLKWSTNERSFRTTRYYNRQDQGRTGHGHDPFCRRLRRRHAVDRHTVHEHVGHHWQRHFDAA